MKISIRKATLEDLDILIQFEQDLIQAERPMDPSLEQHHKITYYDLRDFIKSEKAEVFVAVAQNGIVGTGYGLIKENKSQFREALFGHVGFIFVKEAYRGYGISSLVINTIFDWFRSKNITETRLQVYDQNPYAIQSYQKLGFEKSLIEMVYNLDE